jgi:hypothetical protein
LKAGQTHPDARHAKSQGTKHTFRYVAVTWGGRNAADGCVSTALGLLRPTGRYGPMRTEE